MKLHVLTPTQTIVNVSVSKVIAEAANGSFCLLPRHTDFLSTLIPGLLMYVPQTEADQASRLESDENEVFLACDAGLLVKQGDEVMVSVRQAISGSDLGTLRETVEREFETLDDRSRICQSAIALLEANFLRRLLELETK